MYLFSNWMKRKKLSRGRGDKSCNSVMHISSQSEEHNSVWLVSLLLEGTFASYYPLESTCITYQIHLIYEAHKPILRQLENQERYSPVALFDTLTEYYSSLRQCTWGWLTGCHPGVWYTRIDSDVKVTLNCLALITWQTLWSQLVMTWNQGKKTTIRDTI